MHASKSASVKPLQRSRGSTVITVPLPTGGRCLLELNVNDACQPCVAGIPKPSFRICDPATGVDATRCSSASVGPWPSRSTCGAAVGTARPNIRVSTPKMPELELRLNDASIPVRNGLSLAESLRGFPWNNEYWTPALKPGRRSELNSVLKLSVVNPCPVFRFLSKSYESGEKPSPMSLTFRPSALLTVSFDLIFASSTWDICTVS